MTGLPPLNPRLKTIWHGGDYNPEQWPPATWDEDVRLMQASHFRVATVGVFSWVSLQPAEGRFTFEWLDDVLGRLEAGDRYVCLATPTMGQPAWMSRAYPDTLRADATGVRRHHGRRQNYCPNSPNYRRLAQGIAARLAERYAQHPTLVAWHVSNEYGGNCFCQTCAVEFRGWLQQRYVNLDALNQRWWTAFWSHTYTDWEQIEPPYADGESLTAGLTLDYKRFQSQSLLACFKLERDAIRQHSADVPITTNMLGATTPAGVAVLFDWNNWWAIDNAVGPIEHKEYVATVRKHYRVFHRRNIAVDIVFSDSELSRYDLVIAPMLHMVKAGVDERIQAQVEAGGTFVATAFSGVVDETDLAF